ncbi:MAG: CopG family transcriptional regulator [Chloroflexota bacterium]
MTNDAVMNTEHHDATYHDDHLDDAAEWDEASAHDVTPRPSGMTVFSLRLPRDEFRLLKQEADQRDMSMSELTRTALRFYLAPRATGSLSATALHHLQVYSSYTPIWTGGRADSAQVQLDRPAAVGNVIPT